MLAYFPQIYPGELLYSVLARYHRHAGWKSPRHTAYDLFGREVTVSVDLQGSLGALCARIPPGRGLTPERLAWDCTLYPYYTAFRTRVVSEAALRTLVSGSKTTARVQLGIANGVIRPPGYLRFCPACRVEMLQACGELYWRREHQLPGVLVCSQHGAALADSAVTIDHTYLREFIAADMDNCSAEGLPEPWAADGRTMALLQWIARCSAGLLTGPPAPEEPERLAENYRMALLRRGLPTGEWRAQKKLSAAYEQTLAPVIPLLPGTELTGVENWLIHIPHNGHSYCFHPLRHVLFRLLLEEMPVQEPRLPPSNPFGTGPWPCRNPLADHHGQPVVTGLHIQRYTGRARFSCSCGFVYTVAEGAESKPRIINRGFLFDARLRSLAAGGSSQAAAARALAVSRYAVNHHAAKLGLWRRDPALHDRDSVRSRCLAALTERPDLSRTELSALLKTEYRRLLRNDREWLSMLLPRSRRPACSPSQRPRIEHDWPTLDGRLATAVTREARRLKLEQPPRRVTMRELERRLAKPRWIVRRIEKLPRTAAAVRKALDTTEDFQRRRVVWALAELCRQQFPVRSWRVQRLAHLPSDISPRIASALAAVENGAALDEEKRPAHRRAPKSRC